ncbi:DUF6881 domain-containing protein [Nocardia sp. NBC_01327]|uniref:DUF6881 domain-containing protein n=1 Tax=Nocardia sp. NBC_01327 TaxID=2903593 RepID=UPI002E157FDE|nr:hypothetical protein OG326_02860 [Nocardia sp. NBC_01327]
MSDIVRQQELIDLTVESLWQVAPVDWTEIEVTYKAAGASRRLNTQLRTMNGFSDKFDDPIFFPSSVLELRDLMYVPGLGTWFTFQLTISCTGDVITEFDYDMPDENSVAWMDFEGDLESYPRNTTPKWMKEAIERGQSLRDGDENSVEVVDLQPRSSGTDMNCISVGGIEQERALMLASDFVPGDQSWRYIQVLSALGSRIEPILVFSEILGGGFERRRIEFYRDGHVGLASRYRTTGGTSLDGDPIESASEISEEVGLTALEISAVEFQAEWIAAGGWQA